jgi:hypothetical protein
MTLLQERLLACAPLTFRQTFAIFDFRFNHLLPSRHLRHCLQTAGRGYNYETIWEVMSNDLSSKNFRKQRNLTALIYTVESRSPDRIQIRQVIFLSRQSDR